MRRSEAERGTLLEMEFTGRGVTLGARVFSFLLGWLIRSSVARALLQDLEDT